MKKNYIIFSQDNTARRFTNDDAKLAVCDYAEYCGYSIETPILARIQAVMTLKELVEFFNSHGRLSYDDKISEIVGCYQTIYTNTPHPTEKGGAEE